MATVTAELRYITVNGRPSSVELEAHDENGRYLGTRKSYDPAIIEKTLELIGMFDWDKPTAFLEDFQPVYFGEVNV